MKIASLNFKNEFCGVADKAKFFNVAFTSDYAKLQKNRKDLLKRTLSETEAELKESRVISDRAKSEMSSLNSRLKNILQGDNQGKQNTLNGLKKNKKLSAAAFIAGILCITSFACKLVNKKNNSKSEK